MRTAILAAVALATAACGGPTPDPQAVERGAGVYAELGCGSCHGADLAGTSAAPALDGLATHWQGPDLVAYLRDPRSVRAERPGLQYRSEDYPLEMPAYPEVSQEDIEALARYLLER